MYKNRVSKHRTVVPGLDQLTFTCRLNPLQCTEFLAFPMQVIAHQRCGQMHTTLVMRQCNTVMQNCNALIGASKSYHSWWWNTFSTCPMHNAHQYYSQCIKHKCLCSFINIYLTTGAIEDWRIGGPSICCFIQ